MYVQLIASDGEIASQGFVADDLYKNHWYEMSQIAQAKNFILQSISGTLAVGENEANCYVLVDFQNWVNRTLDPSAEAFAGSTGGGGGAPAAVPATGLSTGEAVGIAVAGVGIAALIAMALRDS